MGIALGSVVMETTSSKMIGRLYVLCYWLVAMCILGHCCEENVTARHGMPCQNKRTHAPNSLGHEPFLSKTTELRPEALHSTYDGIT